MDMNEIERKAKSGAFENEKECRTTVADFIADKYNYPKSLATRITNRAWNITHDYKLTFYWAKQFAIVLREYKKESEQS